MSHAYREVAQLADTFDEILERLEGSFRGSGGSPRTRRTSCGRRSPMEAILSVVRSEPRNADEYEQALDDLADETARLHSLAEQLLKLSRQGQPNLSDKAPVDLSVLVADVAGGSAPPRRSKIPDSQNRHRTRLMVWGDSDSLIRVFLNLLDNAINFTDRGTITIAASREGDKSG